MDDPEIIELLIEAQRGLMAAMMHVACAIEEVNISHPRKLTERNRHEVANRALAQAFEQNTDFVLYARRASAALLERLAHETRTLKEPDNG